MYLLGSFNRILVLSSLVISIASCGGSGGGGAVSNPTPNPTPTPVSVSVSTPSGAVQVAKTAQFTATVSGSSNQTVSWAVNGTAAGSPPVGTISASGLYTAPVSVPNPSTVTITATSAADSTKSGSAGIQIVPPPSPAGTWSRSAPFGGIIGSLTVDPRATNVIYARAFNSGVFKSTDGGQTWAAILNPSQSSATTNHPTGIAVGSVSSTLYWVNGAPPNAMTLFTSPDGGVTLTKKAIPSGIPGGAITIDPKNDSILYIHGSGGIARSSDGGSTWNTLSTAPQNVNALRVDVQNSAVIYAGTTTGVFKSSDSGATWNAINTAINPGFLNISDIATAATNSLRLFVSGNSSPAPPQQPQGEIYISTDGGATWTQAPTTGWPARPVNELQLSAANPNTLYAAVNPLASTPAGLVPAEAVYKSTDGGVSWQSAVTGLPLGQGLEGGGFLLASNAPDVLLYGSMPELFRSSDGAASWSESEKGIYGLQMEQLAFDPGSGNVYAGAANGGGLWKSADQGTSWTKLLNDSVFAVAADHSNSLHLLASDFGQFVLQSTDGGTTWQQTSTPIAIIQSVAFSPTQAGLVIAYSPNGGIARSTDNAATWSLANTGLQTTACRKIAFDSTGGIFAATPTGIYKSSDGGTSWTLKKAAADQFGFVTVVVDPTSPLVIYAADDNSYFKSVDGGSTWTTLNPGFGASASPAISIDPLSHTTLYVSSFGSNVAVSTDTGITWAPVSNGLGFAQIQDILVIPGTTKLFVATFNNGVLAFR